MLSRAPLSPSPTMSSAKTSPSSAASLQLTLSAPDASQTVNGSTNWVLDAYVGQFNGDMTVSENTWAYLETYAWNSSQFELGTWCTDWNNYEPYNITARVEEERLAEQGVVGLNLEGVTATIGMRLDQFGGPYGDDAENEMNQVCSLT